MFSSASGVEDKSRIGAAKKIERNGKEGAGDAFSGEGGAKGRNQGGGVAIGSAEGVEADFVTGDAQEFADGGEVKGFVEEAGVDEEEVGAEDEVMAGVGKRELREGGADVAAVREVSGVVGEKCIRRGPTLGHGGGDGGEGTGGEIEVIGVGTYLGGDACVVEVDVGREGGGATAVEGIDGGDVEAPGGGFGGERGGAGGDVEDGATGKVGGGEAEEALVFVEAAAEEGDGGKIEGGHGEEARAGREMGGWKRKSPTREKRVGPGGDGAWALAGGGGECRGRHHRAAGARHQAPCGREDEGAWVGVAAAGMVRT